MSSKHFEDPFEAESVRLLLKDILSGLCAHQGPGVEVHAAILDSRGDLLEADGPNALHFPALEATVKAARKYLPLKYNETIITNDPYSGNTRLCDLVLIQGAYGRAQANELRYHVAVQITFEQLLNKDMTKIFTSVEDEGFRVPPSPLDQEGFINPEIIKYLCQKGMNADFLTKSLGAAKVAMKDAAAQLIAGENLLGREKFQRRLDELKKYSESVMRKALHEIPDGEYLAHDLLDNDGLDGQSIRVQCELTVHGENILLKFSGSSKQTKGPFNCNYVLTLGACFWVLRSLVADDIPVNSGAFKAFSVEAPDGTVVNAKYPAALLGGYYETSKRIVDVLYLVLNKALPAQFPAQNGGSSNVSFVLFDQLLWVDTLGSGAGAGKTFKGSDAIKAELHNGVAPSIEMLEAAFPIQVIHSGLRESSGGDGKSDGGNGLTRGYKFLKPGRLVLLSDRRSTKARGLFGGVSGLNGESMLVRVSDKKKSHNEKMAVAIEAGDTLVINTPGGGGWGKKEEPEAP